MQGKVLSRPRVRRTLLPWLITLAPSLCVASGCGRLGFDLLGAETRRVEDAGLLGNAGIDAGGASGLDGGLRLDAGAGAHWDASRPGADSAATGPDAGARDPGVMFNGHRYGVVASTQNWDDSQNACAALGMHLVQIDDLAEQTFVWNLNGPADAWIGATDAEEEAVWHWSNGGPQFWMGTETNGSAVGGRFQYWNPGVEPNNAGGVEHCAMLLVDTGGRWTDFPCDLPFAAICESD